MYFEKNSYEFYDKRNEVYFWNFKDKFNDEISKSENGKNYRKNVFNLLTDLIYN